MKIVIHRDETCRIKLAGSEIVHRAELCRCTDSIGFGRLLVVLVLQVLHLLLNRFHSCLSLRFRWAQFEFVDQILMFSDGVISGGQLSLSLLVCRPQL